MNKQGWAGAQDGRWPAGRPDRSDLVRGSRLERWLPAGWWPYAQLARLDRPIGTWLLLFPGWWSIALAAGATGQTPQWWLFPAFGLGALLMRGAGCVVNDLFDRDFDARVERTRGRPLPSGRVSTRQAFAFLAGLAGVSLAILLLLPPTAILLGVLSLLLVVPYPLMKRITWWPQLWLGLTFNWGALLGWAAAENGLGWPALILYAGGIFWTLGYDTIYAHQDREDDALVGIKSTARLFDRNTKIWVSLFYLLATLLFGLAGWVAGLGLFHLLGTLAVGAHCAWQVRTLDIDDSANCLRRFKSNRDLGFLFLAGLLAAALFR